MPAKKQAKKKSAARKTPAKRKPSPKARKPRGPHKNLNAKQKRFAELWVTGDYSATQAYIKAGYAVSEKVAGTNGPRLLENAGVAAYIAELQAPHKEDALRTKDENLRFLASVIATPIGEIGPDSPLCTEYTEDTIAGGDRGQLKRGQAPSGNETSSPTILRRKVKKPDPLRAVELFSRLRGHFEPDRVEIDPGQKTILTIKERAMQIESGLILTYEPKGGGSRDA